MPIGVLTGLRAEAAVLRHTDAVVAVSGGDAGRAHGLVQKMIAEGVDALASFGIAGGLAPGIAPGTLIAASGVITPRGFIACDRDWHAWLTARLPDAAAGTVLGSDRILATAAEKRLRHAETGAIAVDMESHVVALVAVGAGLPFIALRAIADPADRDLPQAALLALTPDGRIAVGAVLRSLARSPGQLPALLRAGRDTRAALGALLRGSAALGRGFGLAA